MKSKKDKAKNGKHPKGGGEHLISQIVNGNTHKQQEKIQQCRYGVYCAHLRMQGECQYPHRRSHYHFLNLIAPQHCLEDEEKEQKELTKREKKERKIIEKTINNEIDVGQLDRRETMLKNKKDEENKKQLIAQLDETEQLVLDLVDSKDVSVFFTKLKTLTEQEKEVSEIRKKALIQLKKKNQKLFVDILDKEYRIANRLIKEWKKTKGSSNLLQLYVEINHNSLEAVREYFQGWFDQDEGIPLEKQEGKIGLGESGHLIELLHNIFKVEPNQYESEYYSICPNKDQVSQLTSNISFYNLMAPFKAHKQMSFVKYLYIDCSELTFLKMGKLLLKDYVTSFYSKFKAAPDFPFGQMEQNINKFGNWASKIATKYSETNCEWKFIMFIDHVQSLFPTPSTNEIEQQKIKERRQLLLLLKQIFPLTYIFVLRDGTTVPKQLLELLQIEGEGVKRLTFK